MVAGIVIYDGMQLLSEDNFEELLDELTEGNFRNNQTLREVQDEMVGWVETTLTTQYGQPLPVEREQILSFLEESSVNDFLAEKTAGYLRDVLEGTRNTHISNRELEGLYRENKSLLERELDISIPEEMDRQIKENLRQIDPDSFLEETVFSQLEDENSTPAQLRQALKLLSTLFSPMGLAIWAAITFVLIVLVVLCCRLKPGASLLHCGIPMTIAGLALLLPVLLAGPVLEAVMGQAGAQVQPFMALLVTECQSAMTPAPLAVAGVGLLFIICAPVLMVLSKTKHESKTVSKRSEI